jgi:cell division protein ZapA (FtsZ GTPase activity inhibitor)
LVLGNQLRSEAAATVARDVDLDLAGVGQNRLAAIAVAVVAALLIATQMLIHLGIKRSLSQRLLQRIEQSALIQTAASVPAKS